MTELTDANVSNDDGSDEATATVQAAAVVGEPGPQGQEGWAPEPVSPARPVAEWTAPSAPSAPRVAATTSDAAVVNPVQAWATLAGNLFALQRRTWASMTGFTGQRHRDR